MIRIGRVASTAGGTIGRLALVFVAVGLLLGVIVGPSEPNASLESRPDDPPPAPDTITLRLPADELAGHLTVVDESGRPLAVLSRWRDGSLSLAAQRGRGKDLGYHLKIDDTTRLDLFVAERLTTVLARADGSVSTMTEDFSRPLGPVPASDIGAPGHRGPAARSSPGTNSVARALSGRRGPR